MAMKAEEGKKHERVISCSGALSAMSSVAAGTGSRPEKTSTATHAACKCRERRDKMCGQYVRRSDAVKVDGERAGQ